MNNKRQKENFLIAAGIGVLAGAVGYGLYSYLSSRNQTENHQSYSSSTNRERKIIFPCPICFEPMSNFTTFACQHSFHKKCIRQWQEFNETCPVCRADLD